ncbi:thioredoxin-related transmembrane protein 4 [Platysternon megacephalum]|uniref:Thioredoxin-related transmembrane protein 4 n=1 Tax=Platysternon megacephalum TaxID=55544 RepID=A0A4D9EG54_9SAUR|nr:thioredoxin-related transmembrane protein 4 [Platysternon megacephalum]
MIRAGVRPAGQSPNVRPQGPQPSHSSTLSHGPSPTPSLGPQSRPQTRLQAQPLTPDPPPTMALASACGSQPRALTAALTPLPGTAPDHGSQRERSTDRARGVGG